MKPASLQPTRGYGFLEKFLSSQRIKMAKQFIPLNVQNGKILDLGCGGFPLFLNSLDIRGKYGIDKHITIRPANTFLIEQDIEESPLLPFNSNFFDIVTMLAVIEHITPDKLDIIISEIYRILKRKGVFIITSPHKWTGCILKIAASLNLISRKEINEHKKLYTPREIIHMLSNGSFDENKIRHGFFECGMNSWVQSEK